MVWFALWLTACSTDEDKDGDSAPPINQDPVDTDCDDVPPVISALEVSNGGVYDFGDEGGEQPTVRIDADLEDEDADLEVTTMYLWFDTTVDQAVDTSGDAPIQGNPYLLEGNAACSTLAITPYSLRIGVVGNPLEPDTLYEFGAIVTDAHGNPSEPAIASGYTPKADGSDGGG